MFYKNCENESNCPAEKPICNRYGYCYECTQNEHCNDPCLPLCIHGQCSNTQYSKFDNKSCLNHYGSFATLKEAECSCSMDQWCEAVANDGCNDDHFYLCPIDSTCPALFSCLYSKSEI